MEEQDLENLSPELDTSVENEVSHIIIPKKRVKSNKSKSQLITTSMLLFTPEERQIRQEKRLEKSKCCSQESWKYYNTKQYPEISQEVGVQEYFSSDKDPYSQLTSMGVLFDPIQNKRRRFLAKKCKHILDTFSTLHECAVVPYIRTTTSKELDKKGRGITLPKIVLNSRPDINEQFLLPGTFAATRKWTQISNVNFEDDEIYMEQWTQTPCSWILPALKQQPPLQSNNLGYRTRANSVQQSKQRKASEVAPEVKKVMIINHVDTFSQGQKYTSIYNTSNDALFHPHWDYNDDLRHKSNSTEGVFDLEDIPIDEMGNPIGQTTGNCEWCGNHILPIPDLFMIKSVWDKSTLYCCKNYMDMIAEVESIEGKLEAIRTSQQMSVKPHTKFFTPVKAKKVISTSKKIGYLGVKKDATVDTFDLHWDPYATRYDIDQWDEMFSDDLGIGAYFYADIVAMASGTYLNLPENDEPPEENQED